MAMKSRLKIAARTEPSVRHSVTIPAQLAIEVERLAKRKPLTRSVIAGLCPRPLPSVKPTQERIYPGNLREGCSCRRFNSLVFHGRSGSTFSRVWRQISLQDLRRFEDGVRAGP